MKDDNEGGDKGCVVDVGEGGDEGGDERGGEEGQGSNSKNPNLEKK